MTPVACPRRKTAANQPTNRPGYGRSAPAFAGSVVPFGIGALPCRRRTQRNFYVPINRRASFGTKEKHRNGRSSEMTSKNFDSDSAMANPRIRYQTPEAVLEDKHLNRAQKIQVLEAWERDEREIFCSAFAERWTPSAAAQNRAPAGPRNTASDAVTHTSLRPETRNLLRRRVCEDTGARSVPSCKGLGSTQEKNSFFGELCSRTRVR